MAGKHRTEQLRTVELFSACSNRELAKIARMAEEVTFPADKALLEQGASGSHAREAYVILRGSVVVRRNGRKIAELGPGESVGEMALFDNGPRTATVVAGTDLTVLVLQRQQMLGLIDEMPALASKMLQKLARRLRESNRKLYG
ncbi:MAG TPA: hypothetical protein DEP66_06490 [Acidimicrobiaceae bacterium]|nr:hypothetical protein [Acidimicrobiaceae bacterium]HCB37832.1 hypothetical protein [Acidimicrobiaceae bacterium]